jgi:hypothetical protein
VGNCRWPQHNPEAAGPQIGKPWQLITDRKIRFIRRQRRTKRYRKPTEYRDFINLKMIELNRALQQCL